MSTQTECFSIERIPASKTEAGVVICSSPVFRRSKPSLDYNLRNVIWVAPRFDNFGDRGGNDSRQRTLGDVGIMQYQSGSRSKARKKKTSLSCQYGAAEGLWLGGVSSPAGATEIPQAQIGHVQNKSLY